ncbi:MlaC/ttg2D family ABC transporter substrate-binding protein [Zavarzinia sp. CC-PAN008]|uniref:MlaC/ttg2D family ABC transporter substrate-binding protein n=1 Tax=Zavarzinia sp. CC-PAN008 TaxID=3243332 RepID=UPI003F7499D8
MPSRRVVLAGGLLFGLAAVTGMAGRPAGASGQAAAFIQNLGNQAIAALTDRSVPEQERRSRFRTLFTANFDIAGISNFVLGRHRRTATPEQQAEFSALFEDYVVKTYAARLAEYAGETFSVQGEAPGQDGRMVVSSLVKRPRESKAIKVDWQVENQGGNYRIVDVVIEGVSMAITQRSEFSSVVVNGGGVDALLARLRQAVAT